LGFGAAASTVLVMPSDGMLKTMNTLHRGLLKISGGKLGWTAAKMPVLELTTVGRKSGEKRSVMLTSPHQDGESILIVASKGGEPTHPAWFLNLRDQPAVEVAWKGGPVRPMTARILDSDERAELWPKVTAKYSNYGGYQEKTDREIPLVMLEPAG
jgi:deazaflavin-dependent oxidoreductase (nitroreductase family)